MTPWEAGSEGPGASTAWEITFWLLFVIDLCVMQYLAGIALITPFMFRVGGFAILGAWLLILLFLGIYVAGLVCACKLRKQQPLVMLVLLLASPIISYSGWYLVTLAGWVPPVLGPMLGPVLSAHH